MTTYPWRKIQPRNDPEGNAAERENERMMREGSQALLIAIAKAHATREGPTALRAFYEMRGEA